MKNDNKKAVLWSILEKYDDYKGYNKLCDSISNFIKGTHDSVDVINIYIVLNSIDNSDVVSINSVIGDDFDACLFSF
jgi:hypothetical protein